MRSWLPHPRSTRQCPRPPLAAQALAIRGRVPRRHPRHGPTARGLGARAPEDARARAEPGGRVMDAAYHDVIRRRLELPLHEGPDKTTTLAEAVRRHVRAGDTVYLGSAHGRPNPLVRELARQWWGKSPAFTLAVVGLGSPWTALVHGGLVRRVITTFMGEGYPFPTPQALISKAVLDGRLEVQNWSMLTFPLRLLAGAMGVPFMPTRSLLGSSMEEDNARDGDFLAADDPFAGVDGPTAGAAASPTATRIGFVRALVPDVALFHAWAADRAGNVLAAAPLNENFYAAM